MLLLAHSKDMTVATADLVALIKAAATEAAAHQERFAAEDTESRKIVDIMEHFLRGQKRVVYGGAAINAHMPADKKFYDPTLNLPDYDFMTPDPFQDCADLITAFQADGFTDVEAKFGIHDGTYKIYVNYRSAADVTYMPPEIYKRIMADSEVIQGIRYASANYLRMNMYLELSRPAGDVSRWEKVYARLLLLNEVKPLRPGHCVQDPLLALAEVSKGEPMEAIESELYWRIVDAGIYADAVFLSGASLLKDRQPNTTDPVLLMTDTPVALHRSLKKLGLKAKEYPAMGELLPARVEFYTSGSPVNPVNPVNPVAVVFETEVCHAYTTLTEPKGYRLASLDLLIQMYYALYFVELQDYVGVRLLCVIHTLIELESERRRSAARIYKKTKGKGKTKEKSQFEIHDVFPLDCIGHQPTLPELKKSHRERYAAKKQELQKALRFRITRKRK